MTDDVTQEACRFPDIHSLWSGAADQYRWLRLGGGWDSRLKGRSGWPESGHLGERRARVGPHQMEAARDNSQGDALGARLCIHVALVVVSHAVRGAGKMWLLLTAVPAFAHRLTVPDVALRALLGAHKTGAGCFLWHSHGALLSIHITGCHTASIPTHILTTLLIGLALLQEEKGEKKSALNPRWNKTKLSMWDINS